MSGVDKRLDNPIWHPDSFLKEFGDQTNDLINCQTGNLVPDQPMWKFWEGFERLTKRLKDAKGQPMLLKLKVIYSYFHHWCYNILIFFLSLSGLATG